MIPGFLSRSMDTPPAGPGALRTARSGWHPANVPFTVSAELRALFAWLTFFAGLAVLLALGHVWIRNQVVEAGYRLSATRQLVARLELEGRELLVLAAAADAPGRLEELGRTRLGMRPPQPGEEVILP
jgi:cell division protein FtsL